MVTFSLKFHHRTAIYVLLAVGVLVAYRIFNHNRTLSRTTRSNAARLSRVKKEFPKLEVTSTSRKQRPTNVNLRKDKSISALHEKLVKLSGKLREKNAIIKGLLSRYKSTKIENSKLKQKIFDLESKNKKLRKEVERTFNSSEEKLKELPDKKPEIIYQFNPNDGFVAPLGKENFKISEKKVFKTFTKTHIFESDNIVPPKEFLFRGPRRNMRTTKSLLTTVKPTHRHIVEAEEYSLHLVNSNSSYRFRREHVVDGIYRFDVHTGVDYEIYLRHPKDSSLIKVRLARTLFPLRPVFSPRTLTTQSELINLILPLAGRTERFNQFMDQFVEVCINMDKNVFLTVVLYGKKDFENVNSILKGIEMTYNFKKYQLIVRDKPFSRGRALHDGVMNWSSQSNVLMFFCDVDITFRAEFLERCRMYSEPTQQVYYPMVFSLYNPRLVYEDNDVPSLQKQSKISKLIFRSSFFEGFYFRKYLILEGI